MAASYPGAVKAFTTKVDGVDDVLAAHVNDLQNEVTAIETDLVSSRTGWILDDVAWAYASANTFTRAGVTSTLFGTGTKIRYKQGGSYKYGYTVGVSGTTVTVLGDALTNAAITDVAYSYIERPQGWPGFFSYDPTPTGFSSLTLSQGRYHLQCNHVFIFLGIVGTSNATTFTATMPIAQKSGLATYIGGFRAQDNGALVTATIPALSMAGATDIGTFFTTWNGGAWTASGTKSAYIKFEYEIP